MQLDFTLSFSESQWICYNDALIIKADSLDEVDADLKKYIQKKFNTGVFQVTMNFDFDRFPDWHRQYMSHYFNREFTIEIA